MIHQETHLKKAGVLKGPLKEFLQDQAQAVEKHLVRADPSSTVVLKALPPVAEGPQYDLKKYCTEGQHIDVVLVESPLNDLRYLNKFFENVNGLLLPDGIFIGRMESSGQRRERQMNKYAWPLNQGICASDYFIHRIWPKLPYLKRLYFLTTRGQNRVISRIELFGRLYSCGFKLEHHFTRNGHLYFVAQKEKDPDFNLDPTYGPIIRLRRMGKGGRPIHVYKVRTMYPYSEYLQEYFFVRHGLQKGGKLKDDPRINEVGRFLRKYWIDEIPMLFNWLRGDCKLIGVRPLSAHYLSLYPPEFQEYRRRFKPGLIPPLYAELPDDMNDIVNIERRYLEAYEKKPLLTDLKYFWRLIYNVLFKQVRSY